MDSIFKTEGQFSLYLAEAFEEVETSLSIYPAFTVTQVSTFINESPASFLNILLARLSPFSL